jgi:hypothetical protein
MMKQRFGDIYLLMLMMIFGLAVSSNFGFVNLSYDASGDHASAGNGGTNTA